MLLPLMPSGAPARDTGLGGAIREVVLEIRHLRHSRGDSYPGCHGLPAAGHRHRAGGFVSSDGVLNGRSPLRGRHGAPCIHLSAVCP